MLPSTWTSFCRRRLGSGSSSPRPTGLQLVGGPLTAGEQGSAQPLGASFTYKWRRKCPSGQGEAKVHLLTRGRAPEGLTAHQCRVQTRNTFLVFSQMEMVNSLYVCSALQVSIDLPASPSKFGSTAMLVQRWGLACLI